VILALSKLFLSLEPHLLLVIVRFLTRRTLFINGVYLLLLTNSLIFLIVADLALCHVCTCICKLRLNILFIASMAVVPIAVLK